MKKVLIILGSLFVFLGLSFGMYCLFFEEDAVFKINAKEPEKELKIKAEKLGESFPYYIEKYDGVNTYTSKMTKTSDGYWKTEYKIYDSSRKMIEDIKDTDIEFYYDGYYRVKKVLKRNGKKVTTLKSNAANLVKDSSDSSSLFIGIGGPYEGMDDAHYYNFKINDELYYYSYESNNKTKTVIYNPKTGEVKKNIDGNIEVVNINSNTYYIVQKNGTKSIFYLMDKDFKTIIKDSYSINNGVDDYNSEESLNESYLVVCSKKNVCGLYDFTGKEILAPKYKKLLITSSKNYFVAFDGNKYGLINDKNEAVLAFNFDDIYAYENYIVVIKDGYLDVLNYNYATVLADSIFVGDNPFYASEEFKNSIVVRIVDRANDTYDTKYLLVTSKGNKIFGKDFNIAYGPSYDNSPYVFFVENQEVGNKIKLNAYDTELNLKTFEYDKLEDSTHRYFTYISNNYLGIVDILQDKIVTDTVACNTLSYEEESKWFYEDDYSFCNEEGYDDDDCEPETIYYENIGNGICGVVEYGYSEKDFGKVLDLSTNKVVFEGTGMDEVYSKMSYLNNRFLTTAYNGKIYMTLFDNDDIKLTLNGQSIKYLEQDFYSIENKDGTYSIYKISVVEE